MFGMPVLAFALAPFPLGCGMVYPIADSLRGHPEGRHGTQPARFVGLWVREETVMHDFLGQAFYLLPNGEFAGMGGMTHRRWHFDGGRLFIDSVSGCGNCYRGNVTTERNVEFIRADEMAVTSLNDDSKRGILGRYRRVTVTDTFGTELARRAKSNDEVESFKARCILRAIDQFNAYSKQEE